MWIFFGMTTGWRKRGSGHSAMTVIVTIPKSAIQIKEATQPLKAKTYNQKTRVRYPKVPSTCELEQGREGGGRMGRDSPKVARGTKESPNAFSGQCCNLLNSS